MQIFNKMIFSVEKKKNLGGPFEVKPIFLVSTDCFSPGGLFVRPKRNFSNRANRRGAGEKKTQRASVESSWNRFRRFRCPDNGEI